MALDGQWRTAGDNGMSLVVTGKGGTIQEARERAYSCIDGDVVPNCCYRDDIGERWTEGDHLPAWGSLGPSA